MLDIRINPHFQDLTFLWIQNIEYAIVAIILLFSHVRNKNKIALVLGGGAATATIGYSIVGVAYQFFPDDLAIQAIASNILAQIWFYVAFTFLLLGLMMIRLPKMSLYFGIPIFLYGMLAITPYIVSFVPFEVLADGTINFHRTFIDDFSQFMFGVILMFGFSTVFISTYKKLTDKIPGILFGVGFVSVICLPAITASTSGIVAYYLHYGVVIGGIVQIIGLIMLAIRKPKVKFTVNG